MDVGKIIVGESVRPVRDHRVDQAPAWKALAWFALLFVSVGLVDIGLVAASADLTGPITRLATYAGMSTGLPLLTIGAIGFLMSGIGARSRSIVLGGVVICGILVLAELIVTVMLITAISPAFAAAPPAAHPAMRQGLVRAFVFLAAFGGALLIGGLTGIRAVRGTAET